MSPSPKTKTLRRVKRIGIAPARRISFGSMIGGEEDGQRPDPEQRSCLGSAFQLL
jgi:hypothetical protein